MGGFLELASLGNEWELLPQMLKSHWREPQTPTSGLHIRVICTLHTYVHNPSCTLHMYVHNPSCPEKGETKWWGRFVFPKFKIDYRTCKTYTRMNRGLCWPDSQQDANTNQSQRRVLSFLSIGAGADACWRKGLDADLTPHAKADCTGEPMASCKSRDNFSRQWYRFSGPCIWQSIFKHTKHLTFVIPKHRQQN